MCPALRMLPLTPQIESRTLGATDGALYVIWGLAREDAAMRFRLRGPNGDLVPWTGASIRTVLRFEPTGELAPGTYTVEHLHQYGPDGAYAPGADLAKGRWYPLERFELSPAAPGSAESPTVVFTRVPGLVWFEGRVPESAAMYAIEVEGLGEVVANQVSGPEIGGALMRKGMCIQAYDVRDNDRFRVVAYGPGGRKWTGAWARAQPDPELAKYEPQIDVIHARDRVTWQSRETSTDDRPPSSRTTPCGRLVVVGEDRTALPHGNHRHVPDSAGVMHSVTLQDGGVVLDGRSFDVDASDVPLRYDILHGAGDDLWLELAVEKDRTTFLRVQNGELTERHVRHGQAVHFWRIDGGIRIRTYGADGSHVLETLREGDITREVVTWPPTFGVSSVGAVNGHPLELPEAGFVGGGQADGSVFVVSQDPNGGPRFLGRYDLEGGAIWTAQLEATEPASNLGLSDGTICLDAECFDASFGTSVAWRNTESLPQSWAGARIPDPEALPSQRYLQSEETHLPEGAIVRSSLGLVLRGADGRTTPATTDALHAVRRQRGEAVEARWFEGDEEISARLECGGEPVGFVPFAR